MDARPQGPGPEVVETPSGFVVRVPQANGRVQEFRCATEEQARHLLAVLAPPQG